jgi:zinc protease
VLFGDHAYGRSTIGRHADVAGLEWEAVRAQLEGRVRHARALVGMAGDIDADRLRARLEPVVHAFTDGSGAPAATPEPEPPRRLVVRLVDKPARTQSQIYVGHLGLEAGDAGYFPAALMNTAFGGTFTARLSREVRQNRGWSYGAYSRMLRSRRRDAFYLWTFPAMAQMVECIGLELDLLRELRADGVTHEEYDFARKYLDNHFLFAVETASLRVALALRQVVLGLPPDFYERYRERVRAVAHEEVVEAARDFVDPENIRISALCTAREVRRPLEELLGPGCSIEVVAYDADV